MTSFIRDDVLKDNLSYELSNMFIDELRYELRYVFT
jgi:hypothetical protein